ncbi:MAG: CHAD domain-containing protein [Rhodobacteraceae bacterium]|nr:CHAD domain-containing protein [Paracoccaceae bacterium]
MPKEVELKVEVSPDEHNRLKRTRWPEGFSATRAVTNTLQSVYFDTDDHALREAGMSLRLRKTGNGWVQTLKLGTGVKAGLSSAKELEYPVDGRALDLSVIDKPKAVKALNKALNGAELKEQFETLVKRTSKLVTAPDGSTIELAIDNGEVIADDKSIALGECEMELQEGYTSNLYTTAQLLLGSVPFRFSPHSKAERGYHLATGVYESDWLPTKAEPSQVTRKDSVEDAVEKVLGSCLDQITHNRMVTLESLDPEGPHQMRVGLRRLRNAFRTFKSVLPEEVSKPLLEESIEVFRLLGETRDFDVLTREVVEPLIHDAPGDIALEELLEKLILAREIKRTKLKSDLRSARVNEFILKMSSFLAHRDWRTDTNDKALNTSVQQLADKQLAKGFKKLKKYGDQIDDLSIEERHKMRKAAKTLRDTIKFFAPLYVKKDRKAFTDQLRDLQEVFGYLNDVAVAEGLLHIEALQDNTQTGVAKATGYVVGCHEINARYAWTEARDKWKKVEKAKRFWT